MIVSAILLTSLRPASPSAQPPSSDDGGKSDFEDGDNSAGASPIVQRFSRHRSRKQGSGSGSSAPEDERKHNPDLKGGVRISGLRKRRGNTVLGSLDERPGLVKNEVDVRAFY